MSVIKDTVEEREDKIKQQSSRYLIIYDFNLVLPNRDVFVKYLNQFNEEQYYEHKRPFWPEIEIDDTDGTMFIQDEDTGEMLAYITGEVVLPPQDVSFRIHHDFYDHTEHRVAYNYIEALCKRFTGTLVGVYVSHAGLEPIKIIHGKNIPTKLCMIDVDTNEVTNLYGKE